MKKKTGKDTPRAGRLATPESTPAVVVKPIERIITIPRYERARKKFGQNYVVQVGEETHKSKVGVLEAGHGADVIDELGRKIAICLKRKKLPDVTPGLALRAVSGPASVGQLDDLTKLKWAKHPSDQWPDTPETIIKSWRGQFAFVEEDTKAGRPGLRRPQAGALHAIAAHWSVSDDAATVVMPTGTGKTEVMLATLVYCECPRILVIVPTDVLRSQTFHKFCMLGRLRELGVVSADACLPRVGFIRTGVKKVSEAREFARECNVLVATVPALRTWSDEALSALAKECSHLFVDEAHHVAAPTWERVKGKFTSQHILQFTATPYRNDGKQVDGKLIYDYPMGKAQEGGYFRPIELLSVDELDDDSADEAIAAAAVERLRADLKAGKDHLILARVKGIGRTAGVRTIYDRIAKDLQPVIIHSQSSTRERSDASKKLEARQSRIIVCVNMFGEGFDLPQLKIAAMHDIHKTLPITLQFVGRFVRQAQNVGDAAVVVNLADPQVDSELQALYAEDPDWNELLKRSSESRIAREVSLQEFIGSFAGDLPRQLPLWNLRPTFSTVVFSTDTLTWNPSAIVGAFSKKTDAWQAVSERERVAIVVVARREDVKWGRYQNIQDHLWHLVVVHWDKDRNLLFVSASDYSAVNILAIAKAVGGSSVVLVNGTKVFRVFGGIERPMVRNLGASKTGMISFTMYFGPEVSSGLSEVEKAQSDLNNLFAWGYEGGDRVTRGCSARKGKFWSIDGGPVMDWKAWCRRIGDKIQDDSISDIAVIKGFLRPVELDSRPAIVPIAAEWGERVVREEEERVSVFIGGQEFKLHEVSLGLVNVSDSGPMRMEVFAGSIRGTYDLVIEKDSKGRGRCNYRLIGATRIELQVGRKPRVPLDEWCEADPIVIHYANGSFSYNQYFVDAPCEAAFDKALIEIRDWTGTNIKVESQGKERKRESVQFAIAQSLLDDFDVVFDDDGSGEAADLVALRREGENEIILRLVHCKYSGETSVGSRVNDLYELCGQAQKCIRWKHMGMAKLVAHLKRREKLWQAEHKTRFIKGTFRELRLLEKAARHSRVSCEVCIVQPGLGKSVATNPALQLLGSTELFLKKTCDARFQVIGSA